MENTPEVHFERRPSDRAYAVLHWTCMAVIGAILLNGLIISRWWPMPRPVGFRVFVFMLLTFNVLWWSIADRRIARYITSARLSRWLRLGIVGFCAALNLPILYGLIVGRVPPLVSNPTWYTAAVTLWHVALPMALPLVASVRLAALGTRAIARRTFPKPTSALVKENESFDPTRRALLKTAFASVPVAMLAGGTAWGRWQIGGFNVHRHALAAPWLPSRLKGLTITQVSDLHVGRLYRPDMLAHLVEQVNALKSDIVVVTGDVVDSSNQMLPPAIDALAQFESRHGTLLCMGNHDEFDDRVEFIRAVRERLPLLINERRTLEIGGECLTLAGVDYANEPEPTRRRAGDIANVAETLEGYDAQKHGPVIALAHHPHTWDVLQLHGVPLTLSGHTHGGQIMMTPPGGADLGLGRALFRYIRGFYRTDESTLFVNSGVGNWFPIRINAPAEIVQIQLV